MDTGVIIWRDLPNNYQLSWNEVHVYRAESELFSACVEQLAQTLSSSEKQRARKFMLERHRKDYIVCRGLLRLLLGCYTGKRPDQIEFSYEHKGKPILDKKKHKRNIFFNLSHSGGMVLYAFAACRWVGIDVEYVQSDTGREEIAERYFYPKENRMLRQLPDERRTKVFYMLWTCKEAYLKATGEGLTGLEQVEIVHKKNDSLSIKLHGAKAHALNKWYLHQIEPKHGYQGALVIKGSSSDFKFHNIKYEALLKLLSRTLHTALN